MPKFNIESYLNSLPINTTKIVLEEKCLLYLPDSIIRFTKLEELNCDDNYLISLPAALPKSLRYLSCNNNKLKSLPAVLPESLEYLSCNNNEITSLPAVLPESLKYLYFVNNKITSLPALPPFLLHFYCMSNKITSLPTLPPLLLHLYCTNNKLRSLPSLWPGNLEHLFLSHNKLTSIPNLPETLKGFGLGFNPIWEIINDRDLRISAQRIKKFNSFRYLYYSLKFRRQFRNWLWEKVRKPKIDNKYNPHYLIANLNEDIDLDRFLEHWINNGDSC
jgi:hypothetical protein